MSVTAIEDFKGRLKLREYYRDFIRCPKCMGLIHWKESPHLSGAELNEAITFPRYVQREHQYYLNERAMIDWARYKGVVK